MKTSIGYFRDKKQSSVFSGTLFFLFLRDKYGSSGTVGMSVRSIPAPCVVGFAPDPEADVSGLLFDIKFSAPGERDESIRSLLFLICHNKKVVCNDEVKISKPLLQFIAKG